MTGFDKATNEWEIEYSDKQKANLDLEQLNIQLQQRFRRDESDADTGDAMEVDAGMGHRAKWVIEQGWPLEQY